MTHRASFEYAENEFITETRGGQIADSNIPYTIPLFDCSDEIQEKFLFHRSQGYHPDCVICQDIIKLGR